MFRYTIPNPNLRFNYLNLTLTYASVYLNLTLTYL
jgi:hypothetical protein